MSPTPGFDAGAVQHAYEDLADGYARRFGEDLEHRAFDRAVLDAAVDLLGAASIVLDLGCGPAQAAAYVMTRGCLAVGMDLTHVMLDIARARNSRLPLINGDVLRLPVRDGAIDAAIAWFSLHNLPRSLLVQALAEVRRVLRREGVFVMVTHAGTGEEIVEQNWHGRAEQVVITYYEVDELRSALGSYQLKSIDVRSRAPLEHEHQVTKLFVTAIAE